ncbi:MAG TPA: hypothetical protein VGC95_12750, partial [Chitinophagaceae bacterium]
LPDGRVAQIKLVQRGWACVYWDDPHSIVLRVYAYYHTSQLRLYKLPPAVLLGSCKRGVKERKSAVKAKTSVINGCKPCKPGRIRGRPRNTVASPLAKNGQDARELGKEQ